MTCLGAMGLGLTPAGYGLCSNQSASGRTSWYWVSQGPQVAAGGENTQALASQVWPGSQPSLLWGHIEPCLTLFGISKFPKWKELIFPCPYSPTPTPVISRTWVPGVDQTPRLRTHVRLPGFCRILGPCLEDHQLHSPRGSGCLHYRPDGYKSRGL